MSGPAANDGALHYDPYDYAVHEDPFPFYRRLRDEAPVYHNPERGFYALSRHADVMWGFRDSQAFSNSHGVTLDPAASGPHAYKTMSFLGMDPPQHTRHRAIVSRAFTPRRIAELEPQIRAIAVEHLDAVDGRDFDFIGDFAGRLPMDVISDLIGVPKADRAELRRLADLLVHREEGVTDVPPAGIEAAFALAVYYQDMVTERRKRPTDDLTSAVMAAEVEGEQLSDDEVMAFLILMVVAGNETTTKLLGNCWYWGWRHPDERAKALADADRIPDWVEETLRYDTSSHMLARITLDDVEVHGEVIPAMSRVLLLAGSANRDDRVFTEPDRYDLDRDTTQTASFGMGRHFCLGASLARLESRVALEEVQRRVVDYDIDEAASSRVHSVNVRGFATLPTEVRWV
jgi:cytochrome P450